MEISATGLTASRRWMDAIAENLANAQTTRTPEGGPYRRKVVTFNEAVQQARRALLASTLELPLTTTQLEHQTEAEALKKRAGSIKLSGVEATISEDDAGPRWVYEPDHPDANEEGFVAYPNVEVVREMADLIIASRSYEANVTALNTAKAMTRKALEI